MERDHDEQTIMLQTSLASLPNYHTIIGGKRVCDLQETVELLSMENTCPPRSSNLPPISCLPHILLQTEPIMCKNNCGFCGNPANENLCSICYREHLKNQNNSSLSHYNESTSESLASEGAYDTPDAALAEVPVSETSDTLTVSGEESSVEVKQKDRNRCYQCRRMVGLLGFTCRCGFTFCSSHRQANIHNCDFDYKTFNRMQLEKRAVKVVADKLERI